MRWIVTGGAGFIGSHFVRTALQEQWANEIVVLDALTYAGNLNNLASVQEHPSFRFVHGSIYEPSDVALALQDGADGVFHFAAESHVDRSITGAALFVQTNVLGTQVLLDSCRERGVGRFIHVSTDEVYGALQLDDKRLFVETTPLEPTSPYAASKASSDLLILAAVRTHQLDAVLTRCSNNFGPYQYPEKFIPLFITNALDQLPLPLYGDGLNVRDWIHVDAHIRGIYQAFLRGRSGQIYNLGGECERSNAQIAALICQCCGISEDSVVHVQDRLAHDRRYAIDCSKAKEEIGFAPGPSIEEKLPYLIDWYRSHRSWWEPIRSGDFRRYYESTYEQKGGMKKAKQLRSAREVPRVRPTV